MAHSGKQRHRDRDAGRRELAEEVPSPHRRFLITEDGRQEIAKYLRYIDTARLAIERQHDAGNRAIVRELRESADRIYDVLNELEPIED